jgi:uncharacterized membrane protein (UPF0127 family)
MARALVPHRLRGLPAAVALGLRVPVATGFRARLLGLALLRRERAGEGLLIPRCRSVHTFGMRFPIDIHFLDGDGELISTRRAVGPWRVVRDPSAAAVLELPAKGGETGAPSP